MGLLGYLKNAAIVVRKLFAFSKSRFRPDPEHQALST